MISSKNFPHTICQHLMKLMKHISLLNSFLGLIAASCIGLIAIFVTYEIISRYIFNSPTLWTQEISRYLLLWALFGGAGYTLKEDRHVKVEIFTANLSIKWQKWLAVLTNFLGLGFSIVLMVLGSEMVLRTYLLGRTSLSVVAVPIFLPQISLLLCGLGLIIGFTEKIIKAITSEAQGRSM